MNKDYVAYQTHLNEVREKGNMLSIHTRQLFTYVRNYHCTHGRRKAGKMRVQVFKDSIRTFDVDKVIGELQQNALIRPYTYAKPIEEELWYWK